MLVEEDYGGGNGQGVMGCSVAGCGKVLVVVEEGIGLVWRVNDGRNGSRS